MKPLAFAALALGVTMLPGFAQEARNPRTRPGDVQERMLNHLDRALNLTDAQKASAKEIRAKHKDGMEAKRKAAQDARTAFTEGLGRTETSADDLRKLHRAMADAQFELLLDHRQMRQEFHAILTPEQREKAARLEGRMEGLRMGHRGGPMAAGGMR